MLTLYDPSTAHLGFLEQATVMDIMEGQWKGLEYELEPDEEVPSPMREDLQGATVSFTKRRYTAKRGHPRSYTIDSIMSNDIGLKGTHPMHTSGRAAFRDSPTCRRSVALGRRRGLTRLQTSHHAADEPVDAEPGHRGGDRLAP